jgi:hypothetical protein
MGAEVTADSTMAWQSKTEVGPAGPVTRALIGGGLLAGPLYLSVGLAQALTRDGFDLSRHALSHLANGAWGWIQTLNFVATGVLVIAAAVGFARVLGRKSWLMNLFLGAFGLSMIAAAVFPADPVDGFPAGTPEGFPTSISATGLVHFAAGALGFTLLAIACFCAAWVLFRRNMASLAGLSLFGGFAVAFGFFGGMMLPVGIMGIWFAVVVGFAWLAVLSFRLNRLTPNFTS